MAVSVTVGGKPATAVTVVDDSTITAVTPSATAGGAVDVVVTTSGGSATLTDGYTYGDPLDIGLNIPTPINVALGVATTYTTEITNGGGKGHIGLQLRLHSPDGALTAADVVYETKDTGDWVTATLTESGGDLVSGVEELYMAPDEDATSDVRITVNRDVSITGTSTATSTAVGHEGEVLTVATYEFVVIPAPSVESLDPASGTEAGGDSVTITGTGFSEGA